MNKILVVSDLDEFWKGNLRVALPLTFPAGRRLPLQMVMHYDERVVRALWHRICLNSGHHEP